MLRDLRMEAPMIPVVQLVVGDGKDGRPKGDCFRACVASIFEMRAEDVPNFVGDWPTRWYAKLVDWLRPMGLVIEHANHDPAPRPPHRPAGWWIASVQSENFEGETHAVVMRGTFTPSDGAADRMAVAHDPSPHPRRTPHQAVRTATHRAAGRTTDGRRKTRDDQRKGDEGLHRAVVCDGGNGRERRAERLTGC